MEDSKDQTLQQNGVEVTQNGIETPEKAVEVCLSFLKILFSSDFFFYFLHLLPEYDRKFFFKSCRCFSSFFFDRTIHGSSFYKLFFYKLFPFLSLGRKANFFFLFL